MQKLDLHLLLTPAGQMVLWAAAMLSVKVLQLALKLVLWGKLLEHLEPSESG